MIKQFLSVVCTSALIVGCGSSSSGGGGSDPEPQVVFKTKVELGEALFSDVNLSLNRTQSCATCHNPDHGFVDNRTNDASTAGNRASPVSLGDDGTSLGDRNAPTAAYAAFSQDFTKGSRERSPSQQTSGVADYQGYLGGQFHDGRSVDLAAQAGGPPTNPIEMGMPDKVSVVARIQENADYVTSFKALYGDNIFDDTEAVYSAMADSIGEFEFRDSETFYPFSSKYDKSLKGEYFYDPDSPAALGRVLFFSSDFTCGACHLLRTSLNDPGEIFTSFEYHNIGVPENTALRAINGVAADFVDTGLAMNPAIPENEREAEEGKFKTPTMRNVAITAPYMHNGVFDTLEAVLQFYEHGKLRARQQDNPEVVNDIINPETGNPFRDPEVNKNIEHELLGGNDLNLTPERIKAFECFFLTLTDERYEHLLDQQKVTECGI